MQTNPPFVFFGTPYVARDTLAYLVAHGFAPAVVVTGPDTPRGRGMALTPSETAVFAREHSIPLLTPEKITPEVIASLRAYACEYALVVAYGKILPQELIDIFPKGLINVHYSLLPKYRGASPVESALLAGDSVTGVTLQKLVKELDAGDILAVTEVAVEPKETTRELRPRLIHIGAQMLVETVPRYLAGEISGVPQDAAQASRAPKIAKAQGELDLSAPARTNWNTYRAYAESPGTFFFSEHGGIKKRIKITKANMENDAFVIERVVPEGKKEMSYEEYLKMRGHLADTK